MTYGSIEQIQLILQTDLLKGRTGGRIQLRPLTAELHINIIHIFHQINCLASANVFV